MNLSKIMVKLLEYGIMAIIPTFLLVLSITEKVYIGIPFAILYLVAAVYIVSEKKKVDKLDRVFPV